MKQRCIYKNEAYWKSTLEYFQRSAQRMEKLSIAQRDDNELRPRGLRQSWHRRLQLISAHYSAGTPLARVTRVYDELLDKLALFNADADAIAHYKGSLQDIDTYIDTLSLLSLGVLFGTPAARLEPVVTFAGKAGQDGLVDTLVVAAGFDRSVAKKVIHKPFEWLCRARNADDSLEASEAVVEFLKKYYAGVQHAYFYNSHLLDEGAFSGYWSFEAAAIVYVAEINDEGFQENVFYPAELTRFARSRTGLNRGR
jgi:hypothetical protein